jgi:protein-S-isoprenylcysteine O-methyltransferase Ste14
VNKLIFTIVAILLLNIAPLLGNPELILHYKTIVLVIAAACLWLSQPAFSTTEAKSNRNSDRFSIVVILIMSSASVVSGVVEWAYFTDFSVSSFPATLLGFVMLAGGILIRVWAINVLGKHFTATATLNQDHQLIRTGPYRFVRHPSYLGAFLAIIGSTVFLNTIYAVAIAIICMSVAYYIRISVEEKMLASYFGKQYDEYQLKTKRFIPFVW